MTALDLRDKFIEARKLFFAQQITIDDLYKAADAYIEAIKAFKKKTSNKKLRIPDRAYLIRAL